MNKTFSKKLLIPIVAVVIGGSAIFGIQQANAAGNSPFSGLSHAIAQKFNLNQSDVQTVVNQYMQTQHANMQQNMQARLTNRLNSEVSSGKITSGQETAITTELQSLQSQFPMSSLKGMTQAQRQTQFQTRMSDLKTWAQSQNINLSLIPFGFGPRQGWHGHGSQPSPTPTP